MNQTRNVSWDDLTLTNYNIFLWKICNWIIGDFQICDKAHFGVFGNVVLVILFVFFENTCEWKNVWKYV